MSAFSCCFVVDQLESRRLLSSRREPVYFAYGTGGDDIINIEKVKSGYRVQINGSVTNLPTAPGFLVRGYGGADRITCAVDVACTILGDEGNDTIRGGSSDDVIDAGADDDLILYSDGYDSIDGGSGFDTGDWGEFTFPVVLLGPSLKPSRPQPFSLSPVLFLRRTVNIDDNVYQYLNGETVESFNLTRFDDLITFTPFIYAFSQTITVHAGDGNDVFGGAGFEDIIAYGDDGNDDFYTIFATGWGITCYGGNGDDRFEFDTLERIPMYGGAGSDTFLATVFEYGVQIDLRLLGPDGPENVSKLKSTENNPSVVIGDDRPNLISTEQSFSPLGEGVTTFPVQLIGLGGDDTLIGGFGDDTLDGGEGNDVIQDRIFNTLNEYREDADMLIGGPGDDRLAASFGNDKLYGNAGGDLLISWDGQADQLFGGEGIDRAYADPAGKGGDTRDGVEISLIRSMRSNAEISRGVESIVAELLSDDRPTSLAPIYR